MNILCCLVNPVGTYLGYPVCAQCRSKLGIQLEESKYMSAPHHRVFVDEANQYQYARDRHAWVYAHRRAE